MGKVLDEGDAILLIPKIIFTLTLVKNADSTDLEGGPNQSLI